RGVSTAVRVHPGEAQATSLRSSEASVDSHSAQRLRGGGRRVAKASSWAAIGQLQVRVQPGRSQGRCASLRPFSFVRHGSHIPEVGSAGSTAEPPPSASALLESCSQVRVHPLTLHGWVLAPNRSASVNPPPTDMTKATMLTERTCPAQVPKLLRRA